MWSQAMTRKDAPSSPLMSFEEAAAILGGLHPNTLRRRKGGTESLTHVSGFGRRVFLIRAEVEKLVADRIAQAQADERARRKNLRLLTGSI
jgi:hypothetical protein